MDLECVKHGEIVRDMEVLSKSEAPSRAKRLLNNDDIMYQTTRPYQRNNYWYKDIFNLPVVASTGYAQLRAKEGICPGYIYQIIHTDEFVEQVMNKCTGGAYPAINPTELAKIDIQVPPLAEQQRISQTLTNYDELTSGLDKQIEVLRDTKSQLMNSIFN